MKPRHATKWLTAIGLSALAATPAFAEINLGMDKVIAPQAPAGNKPWVNIRLLELDGFAPLAHTVEFQVSTVQSTYDDPPLANPGDCCPMPGRGNLGVGEELRSVFMSVNPALFSVPGASLLVQWTGTTPPFPVGQSDPVAFGPFPDAGQAPARISVSSDPSATDYDITITFNPGTTHSKFLATYLVNGTPMELNDSDLAVVNPTGYSAGAVVLFADGGVGVIGAVPEPGTYAMFALGLAGLGLAARRRR
ncbi:MAG: PEP-CTERM sorting domain-containing protein [Burkholderiales bacterium]